MKVHPRKKPGPRHTPAGPVLDADRPQYAVVTPRLPGEHTLLLYTDIPEWLAAG